MHCNILIEECAYLVHFILLPSLELDTIVDEARKIKGTVGARMTGAGFGGSTVSIVEADYVDEFIEKVGKAYTEITGLVADFYVTELGDGGHEILA